MHTVIGFTPPTAFDVSDLAIIGNVFIPPPIPKEERPDLNLYTPEELGITNCYFDIYDLLQDDLLIELFDE